MTNITLPLLLILSVLLTCSNVVRAQRSLPAPATRELEQALGRIGMRITDLSMPPDLLDRDRRRTAFHDSLFTVPLNALDRLDDLRVCATSGELTKHSSVQRMMTDVGLGELQHPFYGQQSLEYVTGKLGSDPTARVSFITSILILRYVSAIIGAGADIAASRTAFIARYPEVLRLDTLWRLSREDETSSLWQMVNAERTQQRKAREVYHGVPSEIVRDIISAGLSLYEVLLRYTLESDLTRDVLIDSVRSVTIETSLGRIAIGGSARDVYTGSYAVIIDVGGDDVYQLTAENQLGTSGKPVQCIIDLDGNDTYRAGDYALGAGVLGAGILIDRRGNDVYVAGDYSVGSGLIGLGIVHDLDGDDTYTSGSNTQGSGMYGIGFLVDENGHDTYRCHAQGQGFGGTAGVGLLSDRRGNDQYIAASPYVDILRYDSHQITFAQGAALGSRPLASGGLGVLLEHDGNDHYICDIYGQGTGYWYGLGGLIDARGDDRYEAYQYAQGSGVHFATGVLRDMHGNDVYVSHGVSMGCGHDVATGVLLDEAGDDAYVVESLSLGGGNANAVSVFMDLLGNDSYIAQHQPSTMGYSDFRRSYGMVGVFVDANGTDAYTSTSRNNTWSMKSTYGVFVDSSAPANASPTDNQPQSPVSEASGPLSASLDSLFIQASAAPLRFQSNVAPARQALASRGQAALDFLVRQMSTQMPRERLTLETVLPQIYTSAPEATRNALHQQLRSDDAAASALAATILSKVRDTSCIAELINMANDVSWRRRRLAVFTWGEIADTHSRSAFSHLLRDTVAYVRQRAAYAFAKQPGYSLDSLRTVLTDDDHVVRSAAVEGVIRNAKRPMSEIRSWCTGITDPILFRTNLRLLACADTSVVDVQELSSWFSKASASTRDAIVRVLASLPAPWSTLTNEQLDALSRQPTSRKQREPRRPRRTQQ